jgi:hypothetical protein
MTVALESIVVALQDLENLEQSTLDNLEDLIRRCEIDGAVDFRKRAIPLLRELQSDSGEHRTLARRIVERLNHGITEKKTRL